VRFLDACRDKALENPTQLSCWTNNTAKVTILYQSFLSSATKGEQGRMSGLTAAKNMAWSLIPTQKSHEQLVGDELSLRHASGRSR
jgi:hypothetical protein